MAGPAYYTAQVNIAMNDDWIVSFIYGTPNADSDVDMLVVMPVSESY